MSGHPSHVLELCAGAGHIGLLALALASDAGSRLVAVDANPRASELNRRNALAAGLGDRVEVRHGHLSNELRADEKFDLVIADPPWVERENVDRFPEDPVLAIDGGPDGLDVATLCLQVADAHLVPRGSLILQVGSAEQVDQADKRAHELGLALTLAEARHFGERGSLARFVRGPSG